MADDLVKRAREALDGVTPGPWAWQISRVSRSVELSGGRQSKAGGDLTVMSFSRWGTQEAAPVFYRWEGNYASSVERADKLAVPEEGREHHSEWFARIDHPDARFIAASRELVPAMADRIRELEAKLATVLAREAETHARHDAKMEALEAKLAKARAAFEREKAYHRSHRAKAGGTNRAAIARAEAAEAKMATMRTTYDEERKALVLAASERDARLRAEAKLAKALEALIWCSGSDDFQEGGKAREGWLKLCAPLVNEGTKETAD